MATDYEVTHLKDIRYKKRTKSEQLELNELSEYMELCSLGDRPMSPKAERLRRYLYLKEKGSKVKNSNQ